MAQKKHTVAGVLYRASFSVDYTEEVKFDPQGDVKLVPLNAFGHPVKDTHSAKWIVVVGKLIHLYAVHAKSKPNKIVVHPSAVLPPAFVKVLRDEFATAA